ncbi:hypothetical protein BGX33_009958, partial [Mortierella sp. NVP41]
LFMIAPSPASLCRGDPTDVATTACLCADRVSVTALDVSIDTLSHSMTALDLLAAPIASPDAIGPAMDSSDVGQDYSPVETTECDHSFCQGACSGWWSYPSESEDESESWFESSDQPFPEPESNDTPAPECDTEGCIGGWECPHCIQQYAECVALDMFSTLIG